MNIENLQRGDLVEVSEGGGRWRGEFISYRWRDRSALVNPQIGTIATSVPEANVRPLCTSPNGRCSFARCDAPQAVTMPRSEMTCQG